MSSAFILMLKVVVFILLNKETIGSISLLFFQASKHNVLYIMLDRFSVLLYVTASMISIFSLLLFSSVNLKFSNFFLAKKLKFPYFPLLNQRKRLFQFLSVSKPKLLAQSLVQWLRLKRVLKSTRPNKPLTYKANYMVINVRQK